MSALLLTHWHWFTAIVAGFTLLGYAGLLLADGCKACGQDRAAGKERLI